MSENRMYRLTVEINYKPADATEYEKLQIFKEEGDDVLALAVRGRKIIEGFKPSEYLRVGEYGATCTIYSVNSDDFPTAYLDVDIREFKGGDND